MINLIGPAGISSLSVDGTDYTVEGGKVSVKPEHVAEVKDFGFGLAPETNDDPNFVPSDDVSTMNRNELFAFLKAKGVVVSPPINNDDLRKIAQETIAGNGAAIQPAQSAPAAPVAPTEPAPAQPAASAAPVAN